MTSRAGFDSIFIEMSRTSGRTKNDGSLVSTENPPAPLKSGRRIQSYFIPCPSNSIALLPFFATTQIIFYPQMEPSVSLDSRSWNCLKTGLSHHSFFVFRQCGLKGSTNISKGWGAWTERWPREVNSGGLNISPTLNW